MSPDIPSHNNRVKQGYAFRRDNQICLIGGKSLDSSCFADRQAKANIHRAYVSSIELGKVSVGIEVANELAGALGIKLSNLIRLAE